MMKPSPLTLDDEQDFVFLGLVSIIDPPREESKAAVADATRAGIKTVMITGDHKVTAAAIAKTDRYFLKMATWPLPEVS